MLALLKEGIFAPEERKKLGISVETLQKALELCEPFLMDVSWGGVSVLTPVGQKIVSRPASTASVAELVRFLQNHPEFKGENGKPLLSEKKLRAFFKIGNFSTRFLQGVF